MELFIRITCNVPKVYFSFNQVWTYFLKCDFKLPFILTCFSDALWITSVYWKCYTNKLPLSRCTIITPVQYVSLTSGSVMTACCCRLVNRYSPANRDCVHKAINSRVMMEAFVLWFHFGFEPAGAGKANNANNSTVNKNEKKAIIMAGWSWQSQPYGVWLQEKGLVFFLTQS